MSAIRSYYKHNPKYSPSETRLAKYEYILDKRNAHVPLREIGAALGISAERVRQIEERLTEKLSEQAPKNLKQTV